MIPSKFVKSAVEPKDYPKAERPEIALVGRSNAGKSSLLNSMTGLKGLARVSKTPGRTRLLNFFEVGKYYSLVDLPGYGFATGDKDEIRSWARMIENYLVSRETLAGIVLICDIRREWEEEEVMVLNFTHTHDIGFVCVLTKADKLSQNERKNQLTKWIKKSGLTADSFKIASALKGEGITDLEKFIYDTWVKPVKAVKK